MKTNELKKLIEECITEILTESMSLYAPPKFPSRFWMNPKGDIIPVNNYEEHANIIDDLIGKSENIAISEYYWIHGYKSYGEVVITVSQHGLKSEQKKTIENMFFSDDSIHKIIKQTVGSYKGEPILVKRKSDLHL